MGSNNSKTLNFDLQKTWKRRSLKQNGNGTLEFWSRHQFLRFEIPIFGTGGAVTNLHHKCSFENPGPETSDAHLYAPEKKTLFLSLICEFLNFMLAFYEKIIKSKNFDKVYDQL